MERPDGLDIIELLVSLKINPNLQEEIERFRTLIDIIMENSQIGFFEKSGEKIILTKKGNEISDTIIIVLKNLLKIEDLNKIFLYLKIINKLGKGKHFDLSNGLNIDSFDLDNLYYLRNVGIIGTFDKNNLSEEDETKFWLTKTGKDIFEFLQL